MSSNFQISKFQPPELWENKNVGCLSHQSITFFYGSIGWLRHFGSTHELYWSRQKLGPISIHLGDMWEAMAAFLAAEFHASVPMVKAVEDVSA